METEKIRKNPEYPYGAWVFIIASFLLGLLDMILLYEKIQTLFSIGRGFSMFIAFIIATIANFTAFQWGYTDGKNLTKRLINKKSAGAFSFWVVIGIVYAAIRLTWIFKTIPEGSEINSFLDFVSFSDGKIDVAGELLQIAILAISYIGTGFLIAEQARRLFDADCIEYRRVKKNFDQINSDAISAITNAKSDLRTLERYENNYATLKKQYNKKYVEIKQAEERTLNLIAGKVCQANEGITPSTSKECVETIIEENKKRYSVENLQS